MSIWQTSYDILDAQPSVPSYSSGSNNDVIPVGYPVNIWGNRETFRQKECFLPFHMLHICIDDYLLGGNI